MREIVKGTIYRVATKSRSKGVMIGISKGLPWELKECVLDKGGRCVVLKDFLKQVRMILVGINVPNGNQLPFWEEIYSQLWKEDRDEMIMMRDVNIIMNTDRAKATSTPEASVQFCKFTKELKVRDVWWEKYAEERDYTYYSAYHQTHSRIDIYLFNFMSYTSFLFRGA